MGDEKELKQDDANRVANHALENLAWIEANMNERGIGRTRTNGGSNSINTRARVGVTSRLGKKCRAARVVETDDCAVGVTARAVGDAMKYHKPKYTRERLVFRYVNALERGDLETVGVILEQAEQDAELERMILEVNDFYVLEQQEMIDAREAFRLNREDYQAARKTYYARRKEQR